MKNYVKKLISSLMAISLAAPVFSGIPVFAENSDGTIVDQTQALTVVGKRIKGDDTYFEISLEVNEDHDNFSSVGVVLRYDPDYIIPAESWDEDAGAADMSENTTWATRRALATLGLETWSTHTALAYQEDTPAPGNGGRKYGYLYLGAEHPLAVEEPEATSDPSATAAPTADPSAPTAEPTASPEPGTRPVVVARFMYKTTAGDSTATPPIAEVTGADMKKQLTDNWTTGTNHSGAAKATNWDYDWTVNEILTIAKDDIAGKSPAQYPFAIYTQDYVEKAYMEKWPTVTPTVTPAPSDPTPTPMPVSAYAPEIGSGVNAANHLTKDDIMIITCEGESAKATGGLKLSDIFVILFFDWDDSLLGTLTTGVGVDATEAVNNYVEAKFIHPDLRMTAASPPDYTTLAATGVDDWKERQWSYRGEFPYIGPNTANPTEPGGPGSIPEEIDDGSGTGTMITNPNAGSNYPLTNKLDYTFAGKDIDPETPFAHGWVQVLPKAVNYAAENAAAIDAGKPEPYPGHLLDIQPKAMSEVWTSADSNIFITTDIDETFGICPEFDSNGQLINASDTIPSLISFDFSNITSDMLKNSDGNLYVKAAYQAGDNLNYDYNNNYSMVGDLETKTLASDYANITLSSTLKFRRINSQGYGVTRLRKPGVDMEIKQLGASQYIPLGLFPDSNEVLEVEMMPTNTVESMRYKLVEAYQANVVGGQVIYPFPSEDVLVAGGDNLWWHTVADDMLKAAYEDWETTWHANGDEAFDGSWADGEYIEQYTKLYSDPYGSSAGWDTWTFGDSIMRLFDEIDALGAPWSYKDLSWYQIQYTIFESTSLYQGFRYLSSEDAKMAIMQFNSDWGGTLYTEQVPELFPDHEELGFY